jgi:hypothetical protein
MSSTKIANRMMILILLICSYATSIRITGKTQQTQALSYANICMSGLTEAMPPGFCWKKGADAGVIPTGCPKGFFRSLALCFEYCAPGYTHILGICYLDCESGYVNHGLTCFKNIISWYFKKSYIPRSLTNFSDEVPCPGNMYRMGALCYRDCTLIGMDNCGIGACIAPGEDCNMKVLEMAGKVIEGIATGVGTVVSFGASTAAKTGAKTAIKTALKSMSKEALRAAAKGMKNALKGKFKEFTLEKARKKVLNTVKDTIKDNAKTVALMTVCSKVWESVSNREFSAPSVEDLGGKVLDTIDILGVQGMVKSCQDTKSDGGLSCAKSVVEGLSGFDPTGILTIAAAFMHPVCDVPVSKPANVVVADLEADTTFEARQLMDASAALIFVTEGVPSNCLWAFDQINFKGNRLVICEKRTNILDDKFNDKIASFAAGKDVQGYFFEHKGLEGSFVRFGKGTIVDDVKKFTFGTVNLDKMISSIWLGPEDLVSTHLKSQQTISEFFTTERNTYRFWENVSKFSADSFSLYLTPGKIAACLFQNNKNDRQTVVYRSSQNVPSDTWPKLFAINCRIYDESVLNKTN